MIVKKPIRLMKICSSISCKLISETMPTTGSVVYKFLLTYVFQPFAACLQLLVTVKYRPVHSHKQIYSTNNLTFMFLDCRQKKRSAPDKTHNCTERKCRKFPAVSENLQAAMQLLHCSVHPADKCLDLYVVLLLNVLACIT